MLGRAEVGRVSVAAEAASEGVGGVPEPVDDGAGVGDADREEPPGAEMVAGAKEGGAGVGEVLEDVREVDGVEGGLAEVEVLEAGAVDLDEVGVVLAPGGRGDVDADGSPAPPGGRAEEVAGPAADVEEAAGGDEPFERAGEFVLGAQVGREEGATRLGVERALVEVGQGAGGGTGQGIDVEQAAAPAGQEAKLLTGGGTPLPAEDRGVRRSTEVAAGRQNFFAKCALAASSFSKVVKKFSSPRTSRIWRIFGVIEYRMASPPRFLMSSDVLTR